MTTRNFKELADLVAGVTEYTSGEKPALHGCPLALMLCLLETLQPASFKMPSYTGPVRHQRWDLSIVTQSDVDSFFSPINQLDFRCHPIVASADESWVFIKQLHMKKQSYKNGRGTIESKYKVLSSLASLLTKTRNSLLNYAFSEDDESGLMEETGNCIASLTDFRSRFPTVGVQSSCLMERHLDVRDTTSPKRGNPGDNVLELGSSSLGAKRRLLPYALEDETTTACMETSNYPPPGDLLSLDCNADYQLEDLVSDLDKEDNILQTLLGGYELDKSYEPDAVVASPFDPSDFILPPIAYDNEKSEGWEEPGLTHLYPYFNESSIGVRRLIQCWFNGHLLPRVGEPLMYSNYGVRHDQMFDLLNSAPVHAEIIDAVSFLLEQKYDKSRFRWLCVSCNAANCLLSASDTELQSGIYKDLVRGLPTDLRYLFLPILSNDHWLLVVFKFNENRIAVISTVKDITSYVDTIEAVVGGWKRFLQNSLVLPGNISGWEIHWESIPQGNPQDCGIYILKILECMIYDKPFIATPLDIKRSRWHLFVNILSIQF